jgi:hypothetical protein
MLRVNPKLHLHATNQLDAERKYDGACRDASRRVHHVLLSHRNGSVSAPESFIRTTAGDNIPTRRRHWNGRAIIRARSANDRREHDRRKQWGQAQYCRDSWLESAHPSRYDDVDDYDDIDAAGSGCVYIGVVSFFSQRGSGEARTGFHFWVDWIGTIINVTRTEKKTKQQSSDDDLADKKKANVFVWPTETVESVVSVRCHYGVERRPRSMARNVCFWSSFRPEPGRKSRRWLGPDVRTHVRIDIIMIIRRSTIYIMRFSSVRARLVY